MQWSAERVIVATYYLAKTIKRACKAGDNEPPGTNCPADAWPFGSGGGDGKMFVPSLRSTGFVGEMEAAVSVV